MNDRKKPFLLQRIWTMLLMVGPGIFCIGYTIGTGSVTSMAKAGSQYGMQLLWVLILSCLFAWTLMEAYGRYAIVSGRTAIHSFRTQFKFGKLMAILVIAGIVIGQWNSLSGIVGLSSNAVYEIARLFIPGMAVDNYWMILGIAVVMLILLYTLLINGTYSLFEKILIIFVTIMGISFLISMIIVFPPYQEILNGLKISIPEEQGGKLMVAAFVGTTMAAPTFVVRPLLMQGKGWGRTHIKEQARDSFISAAIMFVISSSVMITATAALFYEGKTLNRVMDMVYTLEPFAGKFAVALFMVGALSAGISSIFPILMVAPLLIADYRNGKLDVQSKMFKVLTGIACIAGLSVPILGANPIVAQVATQVANVFILPLVILGIIYLINRKQVMGEYRAGLLLNIGLFTAFVFSCLISYTGILALREFL